MKTVDIFAEANQQTLPGRQLQAIKEAGPAFHEWFSRAGTVRAVRTFDLVGLPYPTEYALFRAHSSLATPFVRITNRFLVVQFDDHDGVLRTMLVGPTDVELAENTAYFEALGQTMPGPVQSIVVKRYQTVVEHLADIGLDPADIDYITFDHLHTQDIRRWLGTREPQPDLAAKGMAAKNEPVAALFPNAKLLIMRREWEQFPGEHPLQRRWFQGSTYPAVRTDNIELIDEDVWLGPGVALINTPGHTVGNHSIVLNTSSGVWTSSENGMMPEAYDPESSDIPGLRGYFAETGFEVVLNSNTPESSAVQYNSMVKEKLMAGRGGPAGEHVQHFCSSEMSPWWFAQRNGPGFTFERITHGELDVNPTAARKAGRTASRRGSAAKRRPARTAV